MMTTSYWASEGGVGEGGTARERWGRARPNARRRLAGRPHEANPLRVTRPFEFSRPADGLGSNEAMDRPAARRGRARRADPGAAPVVFVTACRGEREAGALRQGGARQ